MTWLILSLFLIFCACFQSLFLNFVWSPFLLWPPLFYFFLFQSFFKSLLLLFFISLLSSVFLALALPDIFFIYLFAFISLKGISLFLSYKSLYFLFLWVFLFSFIFYGFIEGLDFSSSPLILLFFTLIKSGTSALTALLFFPVLKPFFPPIEGD